MTKGLMRGSEKERKGGTGGFAFCDSSYFAQVVRGVLWHSEPNKLPCTLLHHSHGIRALCREREEAEVKGTEIKLSDSHMFLITTEYKPSKKY